MSWAAIKTVEMQMDETQTIIVEGARCERFPYPNDIGMMNSRPGFDRAKRSLVHESEICRDQLLLILPFVKENTLSTRRKA